jgi:threonyl-tRNA synthetase
MAELEKEYYEKFWHTTAHVFAAALTQLYPNAKIAIGPPIEAGFHYDFDLDGTLDPKALDKIEGKMRYILSKKEKMEHKDVSVAEALEMFKSNPYKVEMINDLAKEGEKKISTYTLGNFTDMCKGPHLDSTADIGAVKLMKSSAAYWKGSDKNKQLQRVYGISFKTQKELDDYILAKATAESNDHNKLGRELELFTTSDIIGQGLPLLMPKGAKVVQLLQRFVEDEEYKRGYVITKTPFMAKSDLYKVSGHWDHYRDGMFILGDENKDKEVFALRPMTCPFQFMIYKNSTKSYRDLPIRYAETSPLFRNESSGEMHGLIRVRQFTISEGHLVVAPDQLEDEFKGVVDLINYVTRTIGIHDGITYRFSKGDSNNKEKYIDNPEAWAHSEKALKKILDDLKLNYTTAEGEAAFYGPKLDLQYKNVFGKEDTIITVQIDFALPERFDMTFVDKDNQKKRPYVIHRTSIGCYERTLAMLIEKFGGAFPLWLAPEQVRIIPISEKFMDYAKSVHKEIFDADIRVKLDERNETLGFRIREAQKEKVPYIIVVGAKEEEIKSVAVRSRAGTQEVLTTKAFVEKILKEVKEKV